MFNIIPIEILFLILDSLDFISINSALRVTKVLYDRSRGFPRDILVRRCEAKGWRDCCKDIFQSGLTEYLWRNVIFADDYDYISTRHTTTVIDYFMEGRVNTDRLIGFGYGISRHTLIKHLLRHKNFPIIKYLADDENDFFGETFKFVIMEEGIEAVAYLISKGVKIWERYSVEECALYPISDAMYEYLLSTEPSAARLQ
jgi:hypothetical protein